MRKDSVSKTLLVATILCVVCSILVSAAAVFLKPVQVENKKLDIKKNILLASGLIEGPGVSKEEIIKQFKKIETVVIDLASGELAFDMNPESFDALAAAKDPALNKIIEGSADIAGIKYRARHSKVYFVKEHGEISKIVLPVHGKGLWSTLYGFLALGPDTKTVEGFGFYEHGETPGLGGEVDNPRWKASWIGKIAYDENWRPAIDIVKGEYDRSGPDTEYKIDGLAGATITAVGVENLVHYWLGEDGFAPFLRRFNELGGIR